MSEPLNSFIAAATNHGRHTVGGDPRRANSAYRELRQAGDRIRTQSDDGQRTFQTLLDHADPSVRTWAAFFLLASLPDRALAVLGDIGSEQGLIALGARTTASEWRAGRLQVS